MQIEQALQERKRRQNVSAFKALIASPTASAFAMPAAGRLRIVSIAGCAAGTTAATLVGSRTRTIKTRLLAAGGSVVIDLVERAVTVTLAAGFDAYVDTGLGVWKKIAT